MKKTKVIKKTEYSFYVERDDGEYDRKGSFKTFKEANEYRCECQRGWFNHCDYVFLIEKTFYANGSERCKSYNVTTMDNQKAFLEERGLSAEC